MNNKYLKGARVSERKFLEVLRYFAHDLLVLTAAKLCGLNYRTVPRLCALLRQRVVARAVQESPPLGGEVEIGESYFGPRRVRGKRGRGAGGKSPVIGLHKRDENVCLSVVKNGSKAELMPIITGRVREGSDHLYRRREGRRRPGAQKRRTPPYSSSPKPVRPWQEPPRRRRGTAGVGRRASRQRPRKLLALRQVSLPQTPRCAQRPLPPPSQGMRMARQTIAALNSTHCSFRSSANTRSKLHKTLYF